MARRFEPRRAGHEATEPSLAGLAQQAKSRLSSAGSDRARARIDLSLIDWLCQAIRMNVKRGRLFQIDRVLSEGEADCLGYATLFRQIGKVFGLDIGIVEVLLDNAGRPVPHVANLARLSDGRRRFIDLWYGSRNIHHRRLGLMAKRGGRWSVVDADWRDLRLKDVKGLPPRCVDAIAGYMSGNRHLERGILLSDTNELQQAIHCYTAAIDGYPENARLHFNRAVAYENQGNREAAEADYAVALRDEASLIRVQARQHDEIVRLIALDRVAASERDREIYLFVKGFVTGREVSPCKASTRYRLSPNEVTEITSHIESQLQQTTGY